MSEESRRGRKFDQKMKPFLVYQYLMRNTDENHFKSAEAIVAHLEETFGIAAERRSIYRDIHEINKAILANEEGISLEEAEERIFNDEEEKTIRYDKSQKGFYVSHRHFDFYDMRLMAECVYSARFLTESQSKRLVDVVCDMVSDAQAEKIKHDVLLSDRTRTTNKSVIQTIETITAAMSKELDGSRHTPEKIQFHYLKHTIDDVSSQTTRRHGEKYSVSPYYFLINDGNYYLLCYDDRTKSMRTYRIDRMKNVSRSGEPREGTEVFRELDLKAYTRQTFSMYHGEPTRITIRFVPSLLDTMIDRFGNDGNVHYGKSDGKHYTVSAQVGVSEQFFGWLLGLGNRVVSTSPPDVVQSFTAYLDKIRGKYQ